MEKINQGVVQTGGLYFLHSYKMSLTGKVYVHPKEDASRPREEINSGASRQGFMSNITTENEAKDLSSRR